jgi:hypothetical protein
MYECEIFFGSLFELIKSVFSFRPNQKKEHLKPRVTHLFNYEGIDCSLSGRQIAAIAIQ